MLDLGSIAQDWTFSAFAAAILAGFAFGFLVLSRIARRMRRTSVDAETAGWFAGAIAGWFLTILVVSQTVAGLVDGDTGWPRILSRLGPYLAGAAAAGLGTWAGLRLDRRKSKEGP